jgi:alkylated DNA nucleotide flippase Atl1
MTKKSPSIFYQKVWQLALQIPPGRVTTYGIICAAAGGHPMMSRMITTILSKSPDVDKIPFHRIVYSNGKIWFDPQHNKWRDKLYKQERIKVDKNNKIVDFEKIIFTF